MNYCECEDWKTFSKKLDSFIIFGFTHGLTYPEEGIFKYCPWCGKKLCSG